MKRGRVLRMAMVALLSCAAAERDPRDVNRDGNVNAEDLRALEGVLGLSEGEPGYLYGADLDDDQDVTLHDYQLWTTPPPAAGIRFVPNELRVRVGEPFSLAVEADLPPEIEILGFDFNLRSNPRNLCVPIHTLSVVEPFTRIRGEAARLTGYSPHKPVSGSTVKLGSFTLRARQAGRMAIWLEPLQFETDPTRGIFVHPSGRTLLSGALATVQVEPAKEPVRFPCNTRATGK